MLSAAALCATLHLITGFCAGTVLPGQPLFSEGHITGKVEEGDIPDLIQHELMLQFIRKRII